LEECLGDGRKCVVFAHHRDCIERIQAHFGARAVHHYGGMSDEEKQANVDRFMTDPSCVLFIGSILASGMGITLTCSQHVVFHELDWRPAMVSQAEDRCHRIGAKGEFILVQHLVLSGSLDARMAELIVEKQELSDRALDRDRESLIAEPIVPVKRSQPKPVSLRKAEIEEQATQLTLPEIQDIHRKLQIIAGMCDNAHKRDGAGFSKVDAAIGHSLAEQFSLTPKQAVLGLRLCKKYHRQIGE
jgi:superfamily II DNA/RNA helicase